VLAIQITGFGLGFSSTRDYTCKGIHRQAAPDSSAGAPPRCVARLARPFFRRGHGRGGPSSALPEEINARAAAEHPVARLPSTTDRRRTSRRSSRRSTRGTARSRPCVQRFCRSVTSTEVHNRQRGATKKAANRLPSLRSVAARAGLRGRGGYPRRARSNRVSFEGRRPPCA
jgi:hypothetical protein